jgi:hypothetical protein
MTDPTSTLTDQELVEEVRSALAGIDAGSIPDDTIIQAKDRFVLPILQKLLTDNVDQDNFDNAVVAWTAEKSFDAWLTYTRLRDSNLETYTDPEAYKEDLRERTNNALYVVDVTRPPEVPNTVVTVTLDDVQERVPLDSNDALLGSGSGTRGYF